VIRRGGGRTEQAVAACCASMGWPAASFHRDPEGRTNAVYLSEGLGVVLSVAGPGVGRDDVAERVRLARAVAEQAPFVRPVPDLIQPVDTGHGMVSLWELVVTTPTVDLEAVGSTLAQFHAIDGVALGASSTALGPARVMRDTGAWIADLAQRGRLRPADARVLSVEDRRLATALGHPDTGATGLLHGDLHWPNILMTRDGAVLCDTDEIGLGSPEYDVAYLFDPDRRVLADADLRAFASGYGSPVPDVATRRQLARRSHLTFTLRLAERAATIRDRFWVDQWLAGWRRVVADPAAPLTPPREHGRLDQLRTTVRGPIERRGQPPVAPGD
jgi:hypothetical protein